MSLLPIRDKVSEEKFVRSLAQNPQLETIVELVNQALEAKRIQLAAHLVALLPSSVEDNPALLRAQKAASFVLVHPQEAQFVQFSDAWTAYNGRKRVKAIKQRMRPKSPFTRRRLR